MLLEDLVSMWRRMTVAQRKFYQIISEKIFEMINKTLSD